MNLPLDPAAILSAFASAFIQNNRLLMLSFSPGAGIANDTLLPWTLTGTEAINIGYRYELVCLCADAYLELKHLIGQPIEVSILTDSGDYRPLCGWVTEARQDGSDGGMARFTLVIEDLFALLKLRTNNRIFQEISSRDAVLTLIKEHQANPVLADSLNIDDRTSRDYPTQALISQLDESDATFCKRKLADEGINFYFEYGDSGVCADRPKVTLVLFDDNSQLLDNPAGTVRYHRADGTEDTDSITEWNNERQLVPGGVYRASPDYKPVAIDQQQEQSRLDQGEAGNALAASLEDYRYESPHYGKTTEDYARYTELRMQAHEYAGKQFTGTANHRAFTIGRFQLADHPEIDAHDAIDREFILTKVALNARNNLPPEVKDQAARLIQANTPSPSQGLREGRSVAAGYPTAYSLRVEGWGGDQKNAPPFTNTFTATRNVVPIVPKVIPTPNAPQLLSAIVVGPAGEEIYTDELGRIRVNLQFTRPADHPEGGASYNDKDSVWLRVVQQWTGSEYGALYIPRVGDEVTLQFIGGDIDRPIVTGTVYNGTHKPATFTHSGDLPGNKALSGIKSKMYKGAGANELVLDDSTNEQRIRVATDHGKTELNQGYLVHPRVEGKGTPRGEGFELRTDLSGALRAALGILISTDARHKATGKQLDRQEFQGQIELALSILKNLSELSTTHHAEDTDSKPQEQLLDHVKHWEAGSNTDKDGDKTKGGKPIVAISGQAGIAISTPQNMTVATGTNLDMVSVQDTSVTTGRSFKARAAELISLFSHKLGMKLVAASGKIDIQAQSDNIEMTAAKKVVLTALEEIILQAPKITTIAQGAGTAWGANQIVSKTLGNHTVHAADHSLTGPAAPSLNLPNMPQSEMKTDEKFVLNLPNMEPRANWKYRVKLASGQVIEGVSDQDGQTEIAQSDMINALNIDLLGPADTPPAAASGEQA